MELAGLNPRRRTAARSPPTTITAAQVLERMRAPVPHVERVDAVVGVARPVEVDVPRVGGEGLLVLADLGGVGGLGQHLLEEVDVARVMPGVEGPGRRVAHDHHAALAHQGLAPVEVEEVPEPQTRHQDRVHDRVDVVGADVGQPHGEDVALALHLDQLLRVDVLGGAGVHRLDLSGLHRGHLVGGANGVEDRPRHAGGSGLERLGRRQEGGPVARASTPTHGVGGSGTARGRCRC